MTPILKQGLTESDNKILISCIIVICDKDYLNMQTLLQSIRDNVHINHEVIIMDNRDTFKNEPLPVINETVISLNGNKFQFEARRRAVMNYARGKYVWFIDGDDKVTGCYEGLNNADMYCFNCTLKSGNTNYKIHYTTGKTITNPFTLDNYNITGVVMWAKFIKLSVLKQVFANIPEEINIHISEDAVTVLGSLYYSKKVVLLPISIYEYNDIDCDSSSSYYTDISKLERWCTGALDIVKAMDLIIPKTEQYNAWIRSEDIYRNNLIDMLKKWFICSPEIKQNFSEIILKYYSFSFIAWTMACWNPLPDKSNLEKIQLYDSLEMANTRLNRSESPWR